MKKRICIVLFLLITAAAVLYSCVSDDYKPVMMVDFTPPDSAELIVRDIRIKGFTLNWTDISGENYEYAIAASYTGQMEDIFKIYSEYYETLQGILIRRI